jgi:hypothetical protein
MKKVIVIDSAKREVYEASVGEYTDIYPLLGEGVHTFACPVHFNESDVLYVDDEGLYNKFEGGYIMKDWHYPICGNGVICGGDEEGESADVTLSVDAVRDMVMWVDKAQCENWRDYSLSNVSFKVMPWNI